MSPRLSFCQQFQVLFTFNWLKLKSKTVIWASHYPFLLALEDMLRICENGIVSGRNRKSKEEIAKEFEACNQEICLFLLKWFDFYIQIWSENPIYTLVRASSWSFLSDIGHLASNWEELWGFLYVCFFFTWLKSDRLTVSPESSDLPEQGNK